MKRYIADAETVRLWAAEAAAWNRPADRQAALASAVRACRELSESYHHPASVAEMLLHEVAESYLSARRDDVAA
ncbi:hypothetical protein AB0O47_01920 [Streptomyces noursei]|uniref:hypothetical protein n=1 Tax=Streptomyces noursei TaxID=1971 RepID=UPI00344BC595